MKFKQAIAFDGRNLNDIFRLPCVESIDKGENGKPYIKLYRSCTEGQTDCHRRHRIGAVQWRHLASIRKRGVGKSKANVIL